MVMRTPVRRKFGTDLSNTSCKHPDDGNLTNNKKKSAAGHSVKKSSISSQQTSRQTKNKINEQKKLYQEKKECDGNHQYSVHFTAGPLGMQLEPVVHSIMGCDLGCRVVSFGKN